MKHNLVYFDDEIELLEAYEFILGEHFNFTGSVDPSQFEQILMSSKPHAILIDFHMPMMNGLTLYKNIMESDHYNGSPIFFISSDTSDEVKILCIQNGAIDFFDRHISNEELVPRIMSKIKAYLQGVSSLELGNLKLDAEKFMAYVNGNPCDLTLAEMRILSSILRGNNPLSKNDLMESIWGNNQKQGKIHVHMSNINLKLSGWNYEIKIKNNLIGAYPKLI